jgi:hypothetical protein
MPTARGYVDKILVRDRVIAGRAATNWAVVNLKTAKRSLAVQPIPS